MAKKEKNHYIDKDKLNDSMQEYKRIYDECQKENRPKPQISNYIAESILKIAENISRCPMYYQYSFRDEMISQGVENCLKYLHNYDPNALFDLESCISKYGEEKGTEKYNKRRERMKNSQLSNESFEISDKTTGAFSYFSQIINFAFVAKINMEERERYVKAKTTQEFSHLLDEEELSEISELSEDVNLQFEMFDNQNDFIKKYEEKLKKKENKKPPKPKGISLFIED